MAISGLDAISQEKNPAVATIKAPTGGSKADAAGTTLGNDLDTFLRLLTTQLKNQDPTQPMDTNQFTQQLVAFSGVEQAVATNKNLETLITLNQSSALNNAVGYIDRTVETVGNKGVLEDGRAPFAYNLPGGADKAKITITNENGTAVFSGVGSTKVGKNNVIWDGRNSFNGNYEPDGVYTITVSATDANGSDVDKSTYTVGRVTSVGTDGADIVLTLGTIEVKLSDVLGVRETPPGLTQAPPPASDDDTSSSETNNNGTATANETEDTNTEDTSTEG